MLANPSQPAPTRVGALLAAAERAIRAIPPAFPLDATVAVNPFLVQTDEDLAHAAARLERGAGVRLKFTQSERKRLQTLESEGGIVRADDVP